MDRRYLAVSGLASLVVGCKVGIGKYDPSKDIVLNASKFFLEYPGNVNKVAQALLDYDLRELGEARLMVYGTSTNIEVVNVGYKHKYAPAMKALRESKFTKENIEILLTNPWFGKLESELQLELKEFLKNPKDHPVRGYFLDVLEYTVDNVTIGTIDIEAIEEIKANYAKGNVALAIAHTHPIHDINLGLSKEDKVGGWFSNAFAYGEGRLFYLVHGGGDQESHHSYKIEDKNLVFELDLETAKLNSLRDTFYVKEGDLWNFHENL